MKIIYVSITNDKIRRSFHKVLKRYEVLHDYEITLEQKRVKSSTMQAQPILRLNSFIAGVKRYKIKLGFYVRDNEDILIADLPEDVLTGWFAHELGHIVDYKQFSNFQMLVYGLKYLISKKFRKKAEHAADHIAIENGFHEEIIATKKFILEHDTIDNGYKDIIRNYYLSISDVRLCLEDKIIP